MTRGTWNSVFFLKLKHVTENKFCHETLMAALPACRTTDPTTAGVCRPFSAQTEVRRRLISVIKSQRRHRGPSLFLSKFLSFICSLCFKSVLVFCPAGQPPWPLLHLLSWPSEIFFLFFVILLLKSHDQTQKSQGKTGTGGFMGDVGSIARIKMFESQVTFLQKKLEKSYPSFIYVFILREIFMFLFLTKRYAPLSQKR
jgi:hypothetical protein